MKIETKRLILRPPRISDWQDIVEGVSDIEVSGMLAVVPHPYGKKDAIWWINEVLKKWKKKNKDDYTFFIELKSEGKVIGATGIHNINTFNSVCTTGSWINKKYWKNGYILEAKIPILDFIFNKLNLRKIETEAYVENKASQKMSKKLGFKLEGKKRRHIKCKATGKIHSEYIFGLFKKEWEKVRPELIRELEKKLK
ncbi:MAG: GNAT family N-acetyltransferase [FCB group bacterium]|nr:GNAT family N-acetyltransferase [FCB group bacterium]